MARSRCSRFPAMAKASLSLLAGAGVAAAIVGRADSDLLPSFPDLSLSTPAEKIGFVAEGVVRSSRALYSITFVVADYKYSLWGLDSQSEEYRSKRSEVHLRSAKRMLKLCETNKGFYVKAGQFVSSLRQVPKEYSSTLSTLQDNTVPCDFKDIKEVIVKNLGKDLSELFYSFDENPIAAASIAQVHHALLRDYQEVAVKVQYPGLRQRLTIDITTMSILSDSVAWIFPEYKLEWMVSEFERSLSSELDFIQEAENAERTARNFRGQKTIKVPQIFWDLTTSQVLTMQFFHGHKVDDLEFLKGSGIDPGKVAKALIEMFSEMIFIHGFVHGDPHPGNILVSPEGPRGFSLVILDHGIYRELDESFRLDYCQLWKALILLDVDKIKKISERFGMGKYARYFPVIFTGRTMESKSALGKQMSDEEKRKLKQDLRALNMSEISSFMESMPSDFLTILRTDGLLRSIMGKLAASGRVRLLTYAKYALYGLATKDQKENAYENTYGKQGGHRVIHLKLADFGVDSACLIWTSFVVHLVESGLSGFKKDAS
ncbi:hypothetical protein Taro_050885 [Colocasia esculenta]|uniref:ABC1 atypical kinase-like domain-containing protein n=1 Tax=Colocasia esculenta TaxID=4460 RepID=A0A843XEI4_COLES|nr:hypothetical protein [Colocasia esculenta]